MAVFLQLPPEMGGLRFGPFDGIVHLGTDARRCQIVLDSNQGIFPIHATLAPAGGGSFHFAPTEMQAKCFVVQTGSPQVWPVQAAVQVNVGDAVVVGTPAGPRFVLIEAAGQSVAKQGGMMEMLSSAMGRPQRRQQAGLGQGLADEVQRRAQSSMMRNSMFRELTYMHRRLKTGQLFSPVTIIGTLLTLGSMLLAGGFTCTGAIYTLWAKFTF